MRKNLWLIVVPCAAMAACGQDLVSVEGQGLDGTPVSAQAVALVQEQGARIGLDRDTVVRQRSTFRDELGVDHVRFERSFRGLPVHGGDFVVHGAAAEEAFTAMVEQPISISHLPSLSASAAKQLGERAFKGKRDLEDSKARLVVYANDSAPTLAYEVVTTGTSQDGTPSVLHTFVDAHQGSTLDSYDEIETAGIVGSGVTIHSGTVSLNLNQNGASYELVDTLHGGGRTVDMNNGSGTSGTLITSTTSTFGNGTKTDRKSAAADAHYGAAVTWDYYKTVHGRNGIANDGKPAETRVHYSSNYNNAFWSDSCFCMTYGDGDGTQLVPLVAIDVAGHEMTHGVTSRTAKLVYSKESGGLNEATSDIFGTAVEFFAGNATDAGDYLIGEKIMLVGTNKFLRSMSDPKADRQSIDNYLQYKANPNIDVHLSSGIANNFFYLISEGGTNKTSGKAVPKIGRAKAEKIWYRALTVYFTSSTTFSKARAATISAAKDLYGATGPEVAAVTAGWTAVGVN
jgi:Zn-dependent metalloprotease